MKAKQLTTKNYTIGIPAQYKDNANLYDTTTDANRSSSLLSGVGNMIGNIISGIGNAVTNGMGMINQRRANDNATALAQDQLSTGGNTTTTILVCAALVAVIYFYFKK